jgi:Raf kinase inhibitor-like YbhB/YbcL family protein
MEKGTLAVRLKMRNRIGFLLITGIILVVTGIDTLAQTDRGKEVKMRLTSTEFKHSEFIPPRFTCQGDDVNPGLIIEDIPQEAKGLALIVDDPDAPAGTWVHWVVFDIPVVSQIKENSVPGKQGVNDFGRKKYGGPCPPSGTHRYFFKIYALSKKLDLAEGISKQELERAMQGCILDKAELIGLYKKQ